jgi:hypothetical protein
VRENWVPAQSIAISQGLDDSGLFTLDFKDDRYLPFEGSGAVSSWSFQMPPETNPIDFDSISDVIVKVRYTARDGGKGFAHQIKQYYRQQATTNPRLLSAAFSLSRMFSTQWTQMMNTKPVNNVQSIAFPVGANIILPNLRNAKLHGVLIQLEVAGGALVSSPAGLGLQVANTPAQPTPVPLVNNFRQIGPAGLPANYTDVPWSLSFTVTDTTIAPLVTNGVLDASKLLDVALVVVYSADPF